eukprot:s393_g1.t1
MVAVLGMFLTQNFRGPQIDSDLLQFARQRSTQPTNPEGGLVSKGAGQLWSHVALVDAGAQTKPCDTALVFHSVNMYRIGK